MCTRRRARVQQSRILRNKAFLRKITESINNVIDSISLKDMVDDYYRLNNTNVKRRMKMNKRIYLDHSATTYTKPEVLEEMLPVFNEYFGNPSSIYSYGREAKKTSG